MAFSSFAPRRNWSIASDFLRGFQLAQISELSARMVGRGLRLFDPGDAVALKRLDALGVHVLHADEANQPATWRIDPVVEHSELSTDAELLDLRFDKGFG
jgi:hypothetical protein